MLDGIIDSCRCPALQIYQILYVWTHFRSNFTMSYERATQPTRTQEFSFRFLFCLLHIIESAITSHETDNRGRHQPKNKLNDMKISIIRDHLDSFQPQASHYQKENAPNRRHISTELTATDLFRDFCSKHPNVCGHSRYFQEMKALNISIGTPQVDQCDVCRMGKEDNTLVFQEHQALYTAARKAYQTDRDKQPEAETAYFSVDLQKVLVLPRMPHNKTAIFTRRLVCFNETFARLGGKHHPSDSYCLLWNEEIQGRGADDIASSFISFILHMRDTKHFIFWADNCAAQNKSWILLSSLLVFLNSPNNGTAAESVTLRFLTSGHTSMSADSIHGSLEQALRRKGEVYDFNDLVSVYSGARNNLSVISLAPENFLSWTPQRRSSASKTFHPLPTLASCVELAVKKDSDSLFWKTSFNSPTLSTKFLKRNANTSLPTSKARRGVETSKVEKIIEKLCPLMPENRRAFWSNLKTGEFGDLLTRFD